jgi:putative transposase
MANGAVAIVPKACRFESVAVDVHTLGEMPRAPRLELPGGMYHLGTRGNRRCPIFLDDEDRVRFLQLLERVVKRSNWTCHAYCLMTNHYHLLIELHEPSLADGMQMLNGRYARNFNEKYGLRGHLFEKRYYDELIDDDVHLLQLSRYIVQNPVRAAICERAGDWQWSSYAAMVGRAPAAPFLTVEALLGMFGRSSAASAARYADFVADQA